MEGLVSPWTKIEYISKSPKRSNHDGCFSVSHKILTSNDLITNERKQIFRNRTLNCEYQFEIVRQESHSIYGISSV